MVDACVVVHVLVLVGNGHSAEVNLGIFAGQGYLNGVSGGAVGQRHPVQKDVAACLLADVQAADADRTRMRFLQFIEVEHGIAAHKDLHNLGGEEVYGIHCVVTHQEPCLCSLLQNDEHTAVHHQIDVASEDVNQLYGALYHDVSGHVEQHAVLGQGGVEGGHSVFRRIGQAGVILLHQFGMLRCQLSEAAEQHAFGQVRLGQCLAVEGIVHHKVERGAHVRHVALEHIIGIDGDVELLQVEPIVGFKELADVGVLVFLVLAGGESQAFEVGEGRCARGIHHLAAVLAYHGFALREQVYVLLLRFHHLNKEL